jgi:hypothetical protein
VWGGDANVNTHGNSYNPASREWTELRARNRARPDEEFDVLAVATEPLVLEVKSKHEWLAAVVAYLLIETTDGGISEQPTGPFVSAATLLPRAGDFDIQAAWNRYHESPFQRATLDDPYPNLRE